MDALSPAPGEPAGPSEGRLPAHGAPARIDALSGLRFAAAIGILLFHAGAVLFTDAPTLAERIRSGGYVWVGLF